MIAFDKLSEEELKILMDRTEADMKAHPPTPEQLIKSSKKPEISYQIIERLYSNAKKIEMFSRQRRPGWDCLENEVESDVILNGYVSKN